MKRWRFLVALFAAALLPGRAYSIVGPSVEGGSLSAHVVMVLNRTGAVAGFCSGIVIGQDVVLTAAHCVPPGSDLRIHFRDEAGNPVLLPVAEVVRNPGYRADAIRSRQRSIDLALIHLPAPLPAPFRPAAIEEAAPHQLGTAYRVAGFGVTQEGNGASSGQLRVGGVEVGTPLSALLLWGRDPQHRGTGACTGDSGGPVFTAADDKVAAMTLWSAGDGKAQCGALTQALWLAPQRDWIATTLNRWGLSL